MKCTRLYSLLYRQFLLLVQWFLYLILLFVSILHQLHCTCTLSALCAPSYGTRTLYYSQYTHKVFTTHVFGSPIANAQTQPQVRRGPCDLGRGAFCLYEARNLRRGACGGRQRQVRQIQCKRRRAGQESGIETTSEEYTTHSASSVSDNGENGLRDKLEEDHTVGSRAY
jgi:hypothetical protein